jgi:L-ascorbate metabolism protein UlaG (beta-lactamase superfamily)
MTLMDGQHWQSRLDRAARFWRLTGWSLFRNPYYRGPASDHFDGRRFFNPDMPAHPGLRGFVKWRMTGEWAHWPERVENEFIGRAPAEVAGNDLRVSFVSHATFLIQTQGLNILTDPVWAERAAPSRRFGPKRAHAPGIGFDRLPRIDVVLLSHNHYDHMDLETLAALWRRDRTRVITPLGNDTIIRAHSPGIGVETLDWGDSAALGAGTRVHAEPTCHWSARGLLDRHMALWASFAIETEGGAIYFVGDSGYGGGHHFRKARAKHGPFRLAILPIGAYEPRWFMSYSHMNPDEAVRGHIDLGRPATIASHFGTFQLTGEARPAPLEALHEARVEHGVDARDFRALKPGESWLVPG